MTIVMITRARNDGLIPTRMQNSLNTTSVVVLARLPEHQSTQNSCGASHQKTKAASSGSHIGKKHANSILQISEYIFLRKTP